MKFWIRITILFFCFGLHKSVNSQDLKIAAIKHFTDAHYDYDYSLIKEDKIKSIEKHHYVYERGKQISDDIVEKYLFSEATGKPTYIYRKPRLGKKSEFFFEYDSLGQLLKKEIFGYANYPPKYQKKEILEWQYKESVLRRQRRYLMVDRMPVGNNGFSHPQKIFLFANDTIIYNYQDTLVNIIINLPAHCQDVDTALLYPPTFETALYQTLKFYPNNNLKSNKGQRDTIIQMKYYDENGDYIESLPIEFGYYELDTVKIDFSLDSFENIFPIDTVKIKNKMLIREIRELHLTHHDHIGPIHSTTRTTTYSDLNKRKLFEDFHTTTSTASTDHQRLSFTVSPKSKKRALKRRNTYKYYKNGLLKKVVTRDGLGRRTGVIEYKIKYL